MSDEDFEDFREMVRRGGLEDCPPEIGAEFQRHIRMIKEVFARYGVTNPDDAPLDIQRAIHKEVKKLIRKPGPKPLELQPGQFSRDLYLTNKINSRVGKIEAALEEAAADLGESVSHVRKRYYELRRRGGEWAKKTGALEKFEGLLDENDVAAKERKRFLEGL